MRHLVSGNIDRGAEVNGAAVRAVVISVGVCRRPSLAAYRREQDLHTAEKHVTRQRINICHVAGCETRASLKMLRREIRKCNIQEGHGLWKW